jgi:hypothetical protein
LGTKSFYLCFAEAGSGTNQDAKVRLNNEATGYHETSHNMVTGSTSAESDTTQIPIKVNLSSSKVAGIINFTLMDAALNLWVWHGCSGSTVNATGGRLGGSKPLAAPINSVRYLAPAGTFSQGSVSLLIPLPPTVLPSVDLAGVSLADFAIPANAKSIEVMSAILDGTSPTGIRLGVGGVPEVAGYEGCESFYQNGGNNSIGPWATDEATLSRVASGGYSIDKMGALDRWQFSSAIGQPVSNGANPPGGTSYVGQKTLAGTLNLVRVLRAAGNFTGGRVGAAYWTQMTQLANFNLAGQTLSTFAIPAGAKIVRIYASFLISASHSSGIRMNGEAAGYRGSRTLVDGSGSGAVGAFSWAGDQVDVTVGNTSTGNLRKAIFTLVLMDPATNMWAISGLVGRNSVHGGGGVKTLAAPLSSVSFVSNNPFDSGTLSGWYMT